MPKFLVVGATGVAGSSGIAAIREQFGADADVTALWFDRNPDEREIEGADRSIYGDITDPACLDAIATQAGESFDWCLYATALGDVGFPIDDATAEQIAAANRLSFDPLNELEQRFQIANMVAYSTFYTLAHQRITYGAMGHSKYAIEQWAARDGGCNRVCIRAGAFRSASSQGIKLLVRRRAKQLAQSENELLRSFFADAKPSEAVERLEEAVFAEEREVYGDSGTDASGLKAAHLRMFAQPEATFMNVCGQKVWASDEVQHLS